MLLGKGHLGKGGKVRKNSKAYKRYIETEKQIKATKARLDAALKEVVDKYKAEGSTHFQINSFDTDRLYDGCNVNFISMDATQETDNGIETYKVIDMLFGEPTPERLEAIKDIHPAEHNWVWSEKDGIYLDGCGVSVPMIILKNDGPVLESIDTSMWKLGELIIEHINKDSYKIKYEKCTAYVESDSINDVAEYIKEHNLDNDLYSLNEMIQCIEDIE